MKNRYLLAGRRSKLPRHRIKTYVLPIACFTIILVFFLSVIRFDTQPNTAASQDLILTSPTIKSSTKSATDPLHDSYGIAAGSSLTSLSPQQLQIKIQQMSALGISWIRLDFDWGQIQPDSSTSYNWSTYDNIVNVITAHHINILGILTYTPKWARASECQDTNKCYPANPQQFANFAATVAKRYSSEGLYYWEIWNEPNNPDFWQPGANPAKYTQLLKATYTALKHANPLSYVLTGGLAPESTTLTSYKPTDFLNLIYANGGKGYFDAVADHPYQLLLDQNVNPASNWGQMAASDNSLRSIMVQQGDSKKKIWITEFGIPTGGPGPVATASNLNLSQNPFIADQTIQNVVMVNALTLYKTYSWSGPFFWYTFQDSGTSNDTSENFFGLVNYYGQPKLTYTTYQNWIATNK